MTKQQKATWIDFVQTGARVGAEAPARNRGSKVCRDACRAHERRIFCKESDIEFLSGLAREPRARAWMDFIADTLYGATEWSEWSPEQRAEALVHELSDPEYEARRAEDRAVSAYRKRKLS